MATANFGTPNFGLPLIVGGLNNYDEDGNYDEDLAYWDCKDSEHEIEKLNSELEHFEVYLESGYYSGYYYNVKQTRDYLDYNHTAEWEEDDADYFYGESLADLKQQMRDEMGKIKQFLAHLKDEGKMELIKVAQFSNGEAMYKEVK